jgi:hypothetical protein
MVYNGWHCTENYITNRGWTEGMFFDEFLKKANQLTANNEPFAVAVVVRYTPPISGKPGDKAIIDADGRILGWIGGGCSQPVVVKEAKRALEDGKPRLVWVSPDGGLTDRTALNFDLHRFDSIVIKHDCQLQPIATQGVVRLRRDVGIL